MASRVDHHNELYISSPIQLIKPSEFTGTVEQLQQIEKLPKKEKIDFIEKLPSRQRRDLSEELIAFFYLDHLGGVAKSVNPSHYEKTLLEIPLFPEGDDSVSLDELIQIYDDLIETDQQILLQKLRVFSEIKTAAKLKEGLYLLIHYAQGVEVLVSIDEEDGVRPFQDPIRRLLQAIIPLLKNETPDMKAVALKMLAEGGIHCDNGMLQQTYKVFMMLKKCTTPFHHVLKDLHDLRDSIIDSLATEEDLKDSDFLTETIETKSDWISSVGKPLGLLLSLDESEEQVDFERYNRDPDYKETILNNAIENSDEELQADMVRSL